MNTWNSETIYSPRTVVLHNGEVYQKDADTDQSEPDAVPGGWTQLRNTNITQYLDVQTSLTSYEQRKADHRVEVLARLAAEGLDPDDVKSVLCAQECGSD